MESRIQIRGPGMWNLEFIAIKAWIGNWNTEFPDSQMDLGMELEHRKFYMELYSQSIQDTINTGWISHSALWKWNLHFAKTKILRL